MSSRAEEQFRVTLYDKPIARLLRRDDYTRLVFDPEYVHDPERDVLGLRFEENLSARNAASQRVPPWFSNLLPEGRLREWIAVQRGSALAREMELLAEVGHDLPGAVRVLETGEAFAEEVDPGSEKEAAAPGDDVVAAPQWRFSLAGVGLKFSMLSQGDRFTAPARGVGGDWIVKLPDPDYSDVPTNEFAMMKLAEAVGISVPPVRLVHRDDVQQLPESVWRDETYAYAVRRFDRGDSRELVHIEDLAQVRGFYPEAKYQGTFETVAALVYRGRDTDALREFSRRLAFNVLIGNGDAHLKNWSLIYKDRRKPTLSPAYDLVATFAYRPEGKGPEDMGLRFVGSRRFSTVGPGSFAQLDGRLKAAAGLEDVALEVAKRVEQEWPVAAEALKGNPALSHKVGEWIRTQCARFQRRPES